MADHVRMCISIPLKRAVSSVVEFIKGKSAISIARNFMGRKRNFTGESFWARGYFVSTVGLEEEVVREDLVAWIIPKDTLSSCFSTQGKPHSFRGFPMTALT